MLKRAVLFATLIAVPTGASAAPILIDDFESVAPGAAPAASIWTAGTGQVVLDPAGGGNRVLHFTGLRAGGDIWTVNTFASTGWLMFDFYGTAAPGSDSGGFIGWDPDTANAGVEQWLGGTNPGGGPVVLLADNVGWRTYAINYSAPGLVHFKLEDWVNSGPIAGNAYFDNIRWSDTNPALVPEPATLLLMGSGLTLVARTRRRRSDAPTVRGS